MRNPMVQPPCCTKIVQGIWICGLIWIRATSYTIKSSIYSENIPFLNKFQLWPLIWAWCSRLLRKCLQYQIARKLWAFRWDMSEYWILTDKYTSRPKSAKRNEKLSFSHDVFKSSTMKSRFSAEKSPDLNSLDNFGTANWFLAHPSDIKLLI